MKKINTLICFPQMSQEEYNRTLYLLVPLVPDKVYLTNDYVPEEDQEHFNVLSSNSQQIRLHFNTFALCYQELLRLGVEYFGSSLNLVVMKDYSLQLLPKNLVEYYEQHIMFCITTEALIDFYNNNLDLFTFRSNPLLTKL